MGTNEDALEHMAEVSNEIFEEQLKAGIESHPSGLANGT